MHIVHAGRVEAVLDLAAPHLDGFSRDEADRLVALMADVFRDANF